jgi:putative membrane protein
MEVLTHPKTAIPKYWRWFLPIAIGWCVGFLVFAKGIAVALHVSNTVTTWLFIGLIAGTVPSLFREAGKEGRSAAAWVSMAVCAAAMYAGLFYISHIVEVTVEPNFWWYNFCGVLWGVSVVIPGMTSSSVMMALGLYQPMLEGLARLDLLVLSACLPGMLLTMLLLARVVSWFFKKHYAVAFHGILGIVLASTLVIIPTSYSGPGEIVLSVLCCGGGFLLAFLLDRLDQRIVR